MASTAYSGISLHATVFIAEENMDKFFETCCPVFNRIIAEPECTFFEIYQSPENPGEISRVESWTASVEWLMEVQVKKDYYVPYFQATEPMYVKPRVMKLVNRVGPPYTMVKKENGINEYFFFGAVPCCCWKLYIRRQGLYGAVHLKRGLSITELNSSYVGAGLLNYHQKHFSEQAEVLVSPASEIAHLDPIIH